MTSDLDRELRDRMSVPACSYVLGYASAYSRKPRTRPARCSGSFAPSPTSRHERLAWQRGKCIGNTGGCFKRLVGAGIWCVCRPTIIVFTPHMTARVQVSSALHCTCTPAAQQEGRECEHDTCTAAQRCPTVQIAADSGGGQCPRLVRQASRPAGCVATCPDRCTSTFGPFWSKVNVSSPYTRGTTLVWASVDCTG